MRIAVPTMDEQFCDHFGQCDGVYLCDADPATGTIERPRIVPRNAHGCESLPNWLDELAVRCVVAGGIGAGAQQRLAQLGIRVSAGHFGETPEDAVRHYLADPQAQHPNACADHDHAHGHEHKHCRH